MAATARRSFPWARPPGQEPGPSPARPQSRRQRLGAAWRQARDTLAPLLGIVTPLGWSVAAFAIVAFVLGTVLGWDELTVLAAMFVIVLGFAVLFVLGNAVLQTGIALDPARVVVGTTALARIRFVNRGRWRTVPLDMEVPIGDAVASFRVQSLGPNGAAEELQTIVTERRGVIRLGPATSVRSDPFGLMVRRAGGGDVVELLVHPRTAALQPFGAGVLRDLEGLTTKDVSPSDLAFHSLREYTPGDDRRFIHWRSYARTGRLQVRQFNDTRRSSLTIVVDTRPLAYADPEEFETALQVAGSLALRAVRDDLHPRLFVGRHGASTSAPHIILDTLSRAEVWSSAPDLALDVARAAREGADTTLAVMISGSAIPPFEMRRAALWFPAEVRTVALRVVPGERWRVAAAASTTLVQVASLRDLASVVASGAIQ